MKAIVTGATGFLGQHLIERLQAERSEVIALGRNKIIGKQLHQGSTRFKATDITNLEQLNQSMETADVIFHCASLSSPWGSWQQFETNNVAGTSNILQCAEKNRIPKIVYVSTTSVYFDYTDKFNIHESDPLPKNFVNHYARSKYLAERVLLDREQQDIECIVIRPRGIIGEGDQAIMPRILRVAEKGVFPVFNRGEALIDLSYVKNVVDGLLLAADTSGINNEIFNLSNNEPRKIKTVLESVFDYLNVSVRFKPLPYPLVKSLAATLETLARLTTGKEPLVTRYGVGLLAKSQTLNIDKSKQLLGYKPQTRLEEGIRRYADWYIKQQRV
jgi:nucleoside-diphosphate-sugar epimerase